MSSTSIRKIGKYARYKPSIMPSVDEIPDSWGIFKLGVLGRFSSSGIDKKSNEDEPSVSMVNYLDVYNNSKHSLDSNKRYMVVTTTHRKIMEYRLKKGDILFTPSSETRHDIGWSAVVTEDLPNAVFSYHLAKFKPYQEFDLRFSKYIGNNYHVLNQFSLLCNGTTRYVLSRADFRSTLVILPPFHDQVQIGRFLDFKNYQINKYIRIKKRQIELLKELKQAIINDAVTGKIDVRTGKPYPKYKDSGIDWLGMMPEDWQHSSLAKVCSLIVDGTHFSPKSYDSGDFMYITAKNIKEQGVDLSDISFISAADHEPIYRRCPVTKGDVLYIKDGATAGIATINNIEEQFSLLSSVALIRTLSHLKPRYLVYFLNSTVFKSHPLSSLTGGAMTRFTIDKLKKYNVLYPSSDEQLSIVDYLNSHIEKINRKINTLNRSIELLSSLQTRLISDVVTGQMDVRDVDVPDIPEYELEQEFEVDAELIEESENAD